MNKEKLLELISVAVDKKASISIHFSQYHKDGDRNPVTGKEAHEMIHHFAEALSITDISHNTGQIHADDYSINTSDYFIACSYVPSEEEKEDGRRKRIEKLEKELAELRS